MAGLFGVGPKPAATSIFGGAAPAGLFGAATPSFGTPAAGAFGAAPATPAFGAAPTTGLFGAASAAPAFGAAPATPFAAAPATFPAASPFGATAATPAFGAGAFGAAPATAAPAFGSAFGAPATAATTPFGASAGSAFGAAAPATGFPFGAAAKPAATPFGATAGAFGAPAAGGGLFGAPASTPAAFTGTSASAFGAAPTAGGLFGTPAAPASTPAFGTAPTAFGAPAASAFGAAAAPFGAATAGSIFGGAGAAGAMKFQPTLEQETNGSTTTQVKFQSITAMPQASGISFEEIRLADYSAGRKGGPLPATAAGTTGLFGAPAAGTVAAPGIFGAPAASPFGAPAAAAATPFGAPAAAPATGLFGAPLTAAPAFGAPAAGSLFGGMPAAPTSTSIFGATAAAGPTFGAPAAGGLFAAPAAAPTSSLFPTTFPTTAASNPAFGSGLSGGLGAFSTLPTAPAAPAPLLSFPGLGVPTTTAPSTSIFSSLPAPTFGAGTTSSLFPTAAPSLAFPGTAATPAFPSFGAPAWPTTASAALAAAQPTLEVRLNTPGAFGALPAVASSLTVPTAAASAAASAPASAPASVGKKPVLAPLLRMTPSSAAKLKPRSTGRSFVYDSLSDPAAAAVPEAFTPRSDLRRLILEPEDAPAPARAVSAPTILPSSSPVSSGVAPVSPSSASSITIPSSAIAPPSNSVAAASTNGVVKPKPTKPSPPSHQPSSLDYSPRNYSPTPEFLPDSAPVLTRPDYYTEPAIEVLQSMNDEELRRVKQFAVGRTGVGRVAFDGDTDVRRLNLDELVHFSAQPREIEVYPEGSSKPSVGYGLNKPAVVTLEACFPAAKPGASSTDPERLAAYEERLKRFTTNIDGAQFVSYDRNTGRWTFRVRHFSKYGTAGLDDDEEGDAADNKPAAKRAPGPPAAVIKPVAKPAPAATSTSRHFFESRALPPRSPAASALSIEEADEEEVLRPTRRMFSNVSSSTGAPSAPASGLSESVMGQTEGEEDEGMGLNAEEQEEEEVEAIEPYGTSAIEEPEDADFAEADAVEDLVIPPRHRLVHAQRREQMRESLFPLTSEQHVDEPEEQREVGDEDEEEDEAVLSEPPVVSLLPQSLFPPRAPERPLASLPVLPAPSGPVRIREKERAQISLPPRTKPDNYPEGRRLLARSFRVAFGPRGMLVIPRVGSSLAKIQLAQVSAGAPLVVPPPARVLRSLPFAAPPLAPLPATVPAEVIAKYVPFLEAHRAASTNSSKNNNGTAPDLSLTSPEKFLEAIETKLSDSVAADDHYALVMWRLIRALFVPLPPSQPHATQLARRRALGKWIAESSKERIEAALRAAQSSNDTCEVVFAHLTGRRLESAASECVRARDLRLAAIVAQALSDDIRANMQAQLASLDGYAMQSYRKRVYALLAGELRGEVLKGIDWLRAFALHLWYRAPRADLSAPSTEHLPGVLAAYNSAMNAKRASAPLPPYVTDLPTNLAQEAVRNRFAAEQLAPQAADIEELFRSRGAFDTLYLLLSLYCDPAFPMSRVINPLGHTPRVLDVRLSWQLFTVLQALGHSPVPAAPDAAYARVHQVARVRDLQWVHALAMSFAAQLESAGLWHWAVYVLLHLPSTEYSLPLKSAAIRHTIARNVQLGGKSNSFKAEEQFILQLGVPALWLHEARAWAARSILDSSAEYEELLAAQRAADAHAVLSAHVAPAVVLDLSTAQMSKEELLNALVTLRDIFGANGSFPREWRTGGGLYLDYLKIRKEHDGLRVALREGMIDEETLVGRRGNLERAVLVTLRVLHGLNPAALPAGQASSTEQGIAWIEMATFLAELLVRLMDSAEQKRQVLRNELTSLPLTENHRHNLLQLCMGSYVGVNC